MLKFPRTPEPAEIIVPRFILEVKQSVSPDQMRVHAVSKLIKFSVQPLTVLTVLILFVCYFNATVNRDAVNHELSIIDRSEENRKQISPLFSMLYSLES